MKRLLLPLLLVTVAVLPAAEEGRASLRALSNVFAEVSEQASPAVVFILAEHRIDPRGMRRHPFFDSPFGGDDLFRRFFEERFGAPRQPQQRPERGQPEPRYRSSHGSGFVVSADGYILTNHHVVADADRLRVTFQDGSELSAELVGSDDKSDVAVIKVDSDQPLPTLPLGRSDDLRVGEWVLAIGNPFGLARTVTAGIISATGRSRVGIADYEDFIQTDAAINPGNSGGPLLDLDGRVVGINTAIFSRSGGHMGIGFAIPIDMAKAIYTQLRDTGKVVRGFLGVGIQDMTQDLAQSFGLDRHDGVIITQVEPGSAAATAGVQEQDVVIALDGQPVTEVGRFRNQIALLAPGTEITLTVIREGRERRVPVVIGQRSEVVDARPDGSVMLAEYGFAVRELDDELREAHELRQERGVVITEVEGGSPAASAGLRPGQLVMGVNQTRVADVESFRAAMAEAAETDRPVRLVLRQGNWNVLAVLRPRRDRE